MKITLPIIKDVYDIITDAYDRNKKNRAKVIKIKRVERHFKEWLEDREEQKRIEKMQLDNDLSKRGLYRSGARIAGHENIEKRFERDVKRKKNDIEDEIKLIELGDI